MGFGTLDPFPVSFLFFERKQLKSVDIRAGHDNHVRIPFHNGFPENGHFTADGGGIGLNRTHAGVIPKCEFEINPGLLVGEGDLYRHGVVCVVERVVGLAIVHVRLRAATQELNLLDAGEGILHEAQGLGCVGFVLNGPLLCFAVQVGGKAVVQD